MFLQNTDFYTSSHRAFLNSSSRWAFSRDLLSRSRFPLKARGNDGFILMGMTRVVGLVMLRVEMNYAF